jgi:hypothetical protein
MEKKRPNRQPRSEKAKEQPESCSCIVQYSANQGHEPPTVQTGFPQKPPRIPVPLSTASPAKRVAVESEEIPRPAQLSAPSGREAER